ncbi:PLP-dependent aminotransferase family protein [Sphingomonas alpina]|uniref:aminotransferase-like domain-containing protein n=1 Tax=Sphingomonas alpina TaxID=653931 RepID=UPI001E3DF8C1|nr:PLP-dependent aminotransferase family protein [Sphingomonas alpina]
MPGKRIPSVRRLAQLLGVSPFTVAAAFENLAVAGLIEARRGSGCYVRAPQRAEPTTVEPPQVNLAWLMHNMLASAAAKGPGMGVLPAGWLNGSAAAAALRAIGREPPARLLEAGKAQGFEPLRLMLQYRLAALEIEADASQIILTTGVTHGLDLVLRTLVRPGDTILVPAPSWFGAFAILAAHRARVIAVPCTADGPDLSQLARLIAEERPRMLVLSATAQNPIGFTLSMSAIDAILAMARQHGTLVFEDDIYSDFGAEGATRLAARDGLNQVIYAGSFSKTLLGNARVGFLACRRDHAAMLAERKILSGFTTPEINERLIHKILAARGQAQRAAELRRRVADARASLQRRLEARGFRVCGEPESGMFLWVDLACDADEVAVRARSKGLLVAPGSLFFPDPRQSSFARFNAASSTTGLDAVLDLAVAR